MSKLLTKKIILRISLLVTLALAVNEVSAQFEKKDQKAFEKAEKFYNEGNYEKAIKVYEQIFNRNQTSLVVAKRLYNTYTTLNQIENAIYWCEIADGLTDEVDPDFLIDYAMVLMEGGRYEVAREQFLRYKAFMSSDNPLVSKYLSSIEYKDKYFVDSAYYSISIISEREEERIFYPAILGDDIYYLKSSIDDERSSNYLAGRLYRSVYDKEKKIEKEERVTGNRMLQKSLSSISIADDTKDFICTYNASSASSSYAKYKSLYGKINEEGEIKELSFTPLDDFGFNILHVALSSNGKTLVFVSDAPGGYGGYDLYQAPYNGKKFTDIKNLGPSINTIEDDFYPYIFNDSILYFSSLGHGGLGGYDVFRTELDEELVVVRNVGYPLNSNGDELGISYKINNKGAFASNRIATVKEDMYAFEIANMRFAGMVTDDSTGRGLRNIDVKVVFESGDSSKMSLADNNSLNIDIKRGEKFEVFLACNGYESKSYTIDSKNWVPTGSHSYFIGELPLIPIPKVDTVKPEPEVPVVPVTAALVKDDKAEEEGTGTTTTSASEQKSKDAIEFAALTYNTDVVFKIQFAASRKKLSQATIDRIYTGDEEVEYSYESKWYKYMIGNFYSYYEARNYRQNCGAKSCFVVAYHKDKRIKLSEGIYMAHVPQEAQDGKSSTPGQPENAKSLKKEILYYTHDNDVSPDVNVKDLQHFVDSLNKNPDYYLEITGYTDSQGSSKYNRALSFQRAQMLRQYFVKKGIDAKRVWIFGFGESSGSLSQGTENKRRVEIELKTR